MHHMFGDCLKLMRRIDISPRKTRFKQFIKYWTNDRTQHPQPLRSIEVKFPRMPIHLEHIRWFGFTVRLSTPLHIRDARLIQNDCAVHTVHSIKCTWYSVCTAYGARRIISQARAALACLRAAHLSRIRCGADLPGSALRGGGKVETATAFNKTIKINKITRHDMLKQTRSRAHTHTQHHQNRKLSNARAAAAASLSTKPTTTMRLWIIAHKHACTHAIDK